MITESDILTSSIYTFRNDLIYRTNGKSNK